MFPSGNEIIIRINIVITLERRIPVDSMEKFHINNVSYCQCSNYHIEQKIYKYYRILNK